MNGIRVQIRTEYGQVRYYPDNDAAEALASIAGTKTLTDHVLILAQTRLGLDIEYLYPEPALANVIDFKAAQAHKFQGLVICPNCDNPSERCTCPKRRQS